MRRLLTLFVMFAVLVVWMPRPATAATAAALAPDQFAAEVLELLNQERLTAGAEPVQRAGLIEQVAASRALDMAANGYFSHYSPGGVSALTLLGDAGVSYAAAGENIARSNHAPGEVVRIIHAAWMASEGHRANMLDARYREAGIGIAVIDGVYYLAVVLIG
jgi:uncharacterized protein YkwD